MLKNTHEYIARNSGSVVFVLFVLVIVVGVVFSVVILTTEYAGAGDEHTLKGYAWSDNIGWISFNCTNTGSCDAVNYGVGVSPETGILSGYAWSDNIGWISFNESELGGCPEAPCSTTMLLDGALSGFVRALSHGGGWDGWINLSGIDPDYGVLLSEDETQLEGYAWGSDVVGWVLFNLPFGFGGVEVMFLGEEDFAECEDTIDNDGDGRIDTLDPGCWSDPGDAGTYDPLDNDESDEPQCVDNFDNDGDEKIDKLDPGCWTNPNISTSYNPLDDDEFNIIQPTIFAVPGTFFEGEMTTVFWECFDSTTSSGVNFTTLGVLSGNTTDIPLLDTTYTVICDNSSQASVDVVVLHPETSINANPALIKPSEQSLISWSGINVESCTVLGPEGLFSEGFEGSKLTGVLVEQSTYTLICESVSGPVEKSVIVNISPEFGEI